VVSDPDTEGDGADQESDPDGVQAEPAGPEAAAGDVRGASHDVGLRRFLAHCESEQSVRHQVQPQQLQGQQGDRGGGIEVGEQVRDGPAHHHDDLPEVAGHGEGDEAAQVVVDDAALLDRADDGGEVVIAEHHVRRLLRDVSAGDAHGHPDVRLLQCRGVVDAVTRHRHDLSVALEGVDEPELVFWRHTGEHADRSGRAIEFLSREPVEFHAGQDHPIAADADLLGDGPRCQGVVTGDHDRPDPRCRALRDGLGHLRPGRVDDAHHAEEGESVLQVGVHTALDGPEGQAQHALPRGGEGGVGRIDPRPRGVIERVRTPGLPDRGEARQQPVHCALDEGNVAGDVSEGRSVITPVAGAHPLAFGVEGTLGDTWQSRPQVGDVHACCGCRCEEARFRGVSDQPGLTIEATNLGIVAQHTRHQRHARGLGGHAISRHPLGLSRDHEAGDRHLVLRQGPRLVRADHRHRPQGFHSRQLPDQRLPAQHPLCPHRQGERHDGGQALRDHGDCHRDGRQEQVAPLLPGHRSQASDNRCGDQPDDGELRADTVQALLQWRAFLLHALQQIRDLPKLRGHPGGHDHPDAPSVRHLRSRVGDVEPITQRGVHLLQRVTGLLHRLGLPGEGRLLDPQRRSLEEAQVSGNHRAGIQMHDVARHQVRRGHLTELFVAHDPHQRDGHPAQRRDRSFRPVLLQEAQQREQHHDATDRACLQELPQQQRQQCSSQQDHHHDGGQLLPQDPPR